MTTQKPDTLEDVVAELRQYEKCKFAEDRHLLTHPVTRWIEVLTALQSREREVREPVAYAVLERENGSPVALCYSQDDASDWVVSSSSQYRNQNISAPRYQVIALTAALKESE